MNPIELAAVAIAVAALLSAVMAVGWVVQQRSGNSGWIDVLWSLGVGGVAAAVSMLPLNPDSPHWRQLAVGSLAGAWSLRLALHIAARTRRQGDDPRYRDLVDRWGAEAPQRMFWFLQSQAGVGAILALSIVAAAQNPDPDLRLQDLAGAGVLASAIVGEAIADRQLRRFKDAPANRHRICDTGLWRWSRHPNYFFEWLVWIAYPVVAIDTAGANPCGFIALAAPVAMYWVLVHVSGIPPLEEHMLRSRGDAFREYQRRTPAFFPLPFKK